MSPLRLGVLITSHNRRSETLACLRSLESAQPASHDVHLAVWLVDDGSTDGTADEVAERYPKVHILRGDGTLFWAAGMARAESAARSENPDYLLWLNDDVTLDVDALTRLMDVAAQYPAAIIVGAARDPDSGVITYGGRRRLGAHPQRFSMLDISQGVQDCDTFHGNCVLIPRSAFRAVGSIDAEFPHAYADDDYGLRARKAGVRILQCPGSIGTCRENPGSTWPQGLRARWNHLQSSKGLPIEAQARYLRRHGGALWPVWLVGGLAKRMFRS